MPRSCGIRLAARIRMQALDHAACFVIRRPQREPTVAQAYCALRQRLGVAAKPGRNWTLNRERIDPSFINLRPAAAECGHGLCAFQHA